MIGGYTSHAKKNNKVPRNDEMHKKLHRTQDAHANTARSCCVMTRNGRNKKLRALKCVVLVVFVCWLNVRQLREQIRWDNCVCLCVCVLFYRQPTSTNTICNATSQHLIFFPVKAGMCLCETAVCSDENGEVDEQGGKAMKTPPPPHSKHSLS